MTNAYHYQNTFDDDLAEEFRSTLAMKKVPPFAVKVEQFEILLSPSLQNETSRSLTLSQSFNKSRSFIQYLGFYTPGSQLYSMDRLFCRVEMEDDDTVSIHRGGLINTRVAVAGQVVEINEEYIEEVIHGTITIDAENLTAISSSHDIPLDQTVLVWTGLETSEQFAGYSVGFANLKKGGTDGAVTVTATRHTASDDTITVGYNLIVLKASALAQAVQDIDITIDENTDDYDEVISVPAEQSITPVNLAQTLLFYGGFYTSVSSYPIRAVMGMVYLKDASTVAASRDLETVHGSRVINITASIVTLKTGMLKSVETQNYLRIGDAETESVFSPSAAISDSNIAFLLYGGQHVIDSSQFADLNAGQHMAGVKITETKDLQCTRAIADANTSVNCVQIAQS